MKADYVAQKAANKVHPLGIYIKHLLTYGTIETSFRSPSTKQENSSRAGKEATLPAPLISLKIMEGSSPEGKKSRLSQRTCVCYLP